MTNATITATTPTRATRPLTTRALTTRALMTHALATRALAALGLLALCVGCPELTGAGARPEGFRLVTGNVSIPTNGFVDGQTTGLQVAAIAVEGSGESTPSAKVYVSDVFDPSLESDASFVLAVDGDYAFNLILQVPGGGGGAGTFLGALWFDSGATGETTLIPRGETDLDIRELDAISNDPNLRSDNVLRAADTGRNPLALIDSDGDGTADLTDADDDDDGVSDVSDEDVAGDGTDDARQLLSALPDEDANGIADLLEP